MQGTKSPKRPQKCGPRPVSVVVFTTTRRNVPKVNYFEGSTGLDMKTHLLCVCLHGAAHMCCDASRAVIHHVLTCLICYRDLQGGHLYILLRPFCRRLQKQWYPSSCATGCTTILPKTVRYGLVNRMSAACGMTGLMSALLLISSLELIKRWCVTVDEVELHVRG